MQITVRLIRSSVFLLALLAGTGGDRSFMAAQGVARPLVGLTGKPLVVDRNGNCPADEFRFPGQDFHASGSTGGVQTQIPAKALSPAERAPTLTRLFAGHAVGLTTFKAATAVMIVDDFKHSGHPLVRTRVPHGQLVTQHLQGLIEGSGWYFQPVETSDSSGLMKAFIYRPRNLRNASLVLLTVDTERLNTAKIAQKMQAGMAFLKTLPVPSGAAAEGIRGVVRVVVNMSFALVPCSVLEDFEVSSSKATMEEYVQAVASRNAELYDDVLKVVLTPVRINLDPLLGLFTKDFQNLKSPGHIELVASAGNYGLDYPLYPAGWPQVIGVGATDSQSVRSEWSNRGDLREMGEWYTAAGLAYRGTSFAAPNIALFSAWDLGQKEPGCTEPASLTSSLRTGSDLPLLQVPSVMARSCP